MSKKVILFALAGALLFSGHMPVLNGALTRSHAVPPSWLSLPTDANVAHIDFAGSPGAEKKRGTIRLLIDEDTPQVLSSMTSTLALEGFVIEGAQIETPLASAPTGFMRASHPATGRSATIMLRPSSLNGEIRISYNDPS